jgi:hypothetical protein
MTYSELIAMRIQWALCRLAYQVTIWWPWMIRKLLPSAGEYAHAESFKWFCANRDRLEGKITNEEFWT